MIDADNPQGQATPRQVKAVLTDALAARTLPDHQRRCAVRRLGARLDDVKRLSDHVE